jgi:branched-chain amino acid transport system ATP-binding protein
MSSTNTNTHDEKEDFHEEEIKEEMNYITDETLLHVNNLKKSFEGLIAVNDVSFEVKKGELVGIIGPNGAGKTTLFNLLTGFLKPDHGKITFRRKNITKLKPEKIAKLGMVRSFQRARPFKMLTATQNTAVPHTSRKFLQTPATLKNRATWSLITVDLGEKKNFPAIILSHGDLKRLDFARAMALKPDMLLLDEPFAGLSAEEAFRVERIIKEARKEGMTAIIVEHKLNILMKLVDRVIVINEGKIIANGTPEEIIKNEEVIKAYLGVEVDNL